MEAILEERSAVAYDNFNDWKIFQKDTEAKDCTLRRFDLENIISKDHTIFGYIPKTKLTGCYVKYLANPEKNTYLIGICLGDIHGRCVIATDVGYAGWILPERWTLCNFVPPKFYCYYQ